MMEIFGEVSTRQEDLRHKLTLVCVCVCVCACMRLWYSLLCNAPETVLMQGRSLLQCKLIRPRLLSRFCKISIKILTGPSLISCCSVSCY